MTSAGLRGAVGLGLATALLVGCASSGVGTASDLSITTPNVGGGTERIPATMARPPGAGPFPAVVIMHDCSGLGTASSGAPARWATELVGRGYVVLMPDSFATRGYGTGVCTPSPGRIDVSPSRRARDAYAALAYLRTLPYVDGRRVGLMGGSHGGTTTLVSMAGPDGNGAARGGRTGFAAAVALYPRCATRMGSWSGDGAGVYRPLAPVLVLIGDKDDWTPPEPCRKLTAAARQAGHPVTLKVYPGAHHSFDSDKPVRYVATRINPAAASGRGATTGGDPGAWADSIRQVVGFFAEHLD